MNEIKQLIARSEAGLNEQSKKLELDEDEKYGFFKGWRACIDWLRQNKKEKL